MIDGVVIETGKPPCLSVIWLHGLGADGHDFEPIIPYLNIQQEYAIRFIFPHAPMRSVSVNFGMNMRAWYDILDPTIAGKGSEDLQGITESKQIVEELIEEELNLVGEHKRIVLAGFSQGGAVALYAGLRHQLTLAGILALSSYLPFSQATETEASEANQDTPIMLRHGSYDQVITVENANSSYAMLRELGYAIDWKTYPIAHSVSGEICADVGKWLTQLCTAVQQ